MQNINQLWDQNLNSQITIEGDNRLPRSERSPAKLGNPHTKWAEKWLLNLGLLIIYGGIRKNN